MFSNLAQKTPGIELVTLVWLANMPDDMLEDVITVAKKALEEHEFEEEGVEVSTELLIILV